MEKQMHIETQDITTTFFDYVRKIRNSDFYKSIGTSAQSVSKDPKNDLINVMNVSQEQENLKAIIQRKKAEIERKNSNNNFVIENINNNLLEIIGLENIQLIDLVEIKSDFQYTINLLKLKSALARQGVQIEINTALDLIVKHLIENEIMSNHEIVKDKKENNLFLNFNLTNKVIVVMLEDTKALISGEKHICNIKNQEILIDYSSPNVAKQMTVGHLRSTLIGEVFKNLFEKKGQAVVLGFNHLGDWGEQFGKIFFTLVYASEEEINNFITEFKANPNKGLFDIYINYKKVSANFPNAREMIKDLNAKLNKGDVNLLGIWKLIRQISIKDFDKIYKRLGINFESRLGEAFYEVFMDDVINDLKQENFLVQDEEGEKIYILKSGKDQLQLLKNNDPILIEHFKNNNENVFQKVLRNSEGVTNYLTRDIAALKFRRKYIGVDYVMYLTDVGQGDHFKVLDTVGQSLNYIGENNFQHIGFGLYLKDGKKMSSREGNVEKLSEIFDMVDKILENDVLSNVSILINDLKQQIHKGVEFNTDALTKSDGDTGIYLLYTTVRLKKILKDNNFIGSEKIDSEKLPQIYKNSLSTIFKYKDMLTSTIETRKLNIIIEYAFEIAHKLNNIYSNGDNISQIKDMSQKQAILEIISIGSRILEDILGLINIEIPEKM